MGNAYLTIFLAERKGNALKVTVAKKMFANLMVITARVIQTVLSIIYVIMDIVIISQPVKYIAIIMCNVLLGMSVLNINALNVDMQTHLHNPGRKATHLVIHTQRVNLTLIAMKMNLAWMVCAKKKKNVTKRKNAIMGMFVSIKNVTLFVKVEHCVLKDFSVDLKLV